MNSSSDESSDSNLTLSDIQKEADLVIQSPLPPKSRVKYKLAYDKFMQWKTDRKSKSLSESVFLAYFRELSKKMKPSSLWNMYSMLKSTVLLNHNLNIKSYRNLLLMLKKQSDGYKSKKTKVLTEQNVEKFINEAPDSHYLAVKVVLIFGIQGKCRCKEIINITLNDIESHDNAMIITLRDSITKIDRTFVVRDSLLALVKKYQAFRPVGVNTNRFFLHYRKGHCTKQVIGKHKIAEMPKIIATYLNLPNPELYTGHCFRRSSAAMLAESGAKQITLNYGGKKTDRMAEIYIEDIEEVDDKSNITLKKSPKGAFTPAQEPNESPPGLSPISIEKMIQISNTALELFKNASATDDGPSTATISVQTHQNVADAKKHGGRGKKRKVEPVYESSESSDDSLASDYSEGAQPRALGAAPTLCCCCLSGAGVAGLADAGPDGAAPAHSLAYCFDINYPLELRAASSICRECVAKLHDGVQFKRRALECLSILTDYRETDEMQAEGSQQPDARETYNIVCEEDNTVTVKQEPLDADDAVEVSIDATVSDFDKIQQEYDLTTGNDELLSPADHEPFDANQHMNTPIFTETPVTEEDIQNFTKQTPEDVKFFKDGCKCEKNCHKLFSKYEILEFRKECEKYRTDFVCNTKHLDIFLTGALACIAGRAIPKQEVKLQFRDIPVCQEFFMYIFALNQQQFDVILSKILDRTAYQSSHKHIIDQHFAIKFLRDYSTQHSLILPGRFSNKHPDLHILPRNVTKTTVYSEYAKACVTMKKKCINQITWDRLWERLCPYIVRKVPSDLCVVCRDNNARAAAGAAPAVWQQQLRHLQLARDAAALRRRALGGAGAGGALQCGVDWLQPLRLRAGGAALLAVARPPPHGAVVYVAPQRVAGGCQPANLLLSLLHHFLQAGAAQWHCGPRLRAERVLQYAAWRGRAARTALAFLPRGHDAAPLAPAAALLAVALRHRPAQSLEQICEILSSMNVTPIVVATEEGDLNIPIYDWIAYFDARNPVPVKNIQDYCYFEANSDNVGAIKCKVSADSDKTDVVSVFADTCLTGSPQILPQPSKQVPIEIPITLPTGQSGERRKVMEKPHVEENEVLIEFCPNDAQDPLELVKQEVDMDFEDHEVS